MEGGDKKDNEGCLTIITFWGFIITVFAIASHMAESDRESAITILAVGFFSVFGFFIYKVIVGRTLKETKNNAKGCLCLIVVAFFAIIVVGVVGMVLPSSCTESNEPDYIDLPYRT
jgi:uncharacterized membrane protein